MSIATVRYLSLFSGVEAATLAWQPLGWEAVAFAEIEPFPCAVLAHHYPGVPNLGDVTRITEADIAALDRIDLVVFGSPCQDLSMAGGRAGFSGARSGLFHTAMRIVRWARKHGNCRFALWENVFGAFSSNEGRDFAAVVSEMAGCWDVAVPANGWGTEGAALGDDGLLEWGTLDAQWFGVAQRRRRVFAVADFGNWSDRRPILLERESLRGNCPSADRQGTGALKAGTGEAGCWWDGGQLSQTLDAVLYKKQALPEKNRFPAVIVDGRLRFITVLEAERLQGFPDFHTAVPFRGKLAANGPRYKAIGNSIATPCLKWIGEGIQNAAIQK